VNEQYIDSIMHAATIKVMKVIFSFLQQHTILKLFGEW